MTAAAPTAPTAAKTDAARPIQRRSGTLLVDVEESAGSLAAVGWAARHAHRLIVATEALLQCARMHACEASVIGSPDGDHNVSDELLRIADVPVIVVPSHRHPPEDRS